jgi:hypothetical protein
VVATATKDALVPPLYPRNAVDTTIVVPDEQLETNTVGPLTVPVTVEPEEHVPRAVARLVASELAVLVDPQLTITVLSGAPPPLGKTKIKKFPVCPLCSVPAKVTAVAAVDVGRLITGVIVAPEVVTANEACANCDECPSILALIT